MEKNTQKFKSLLQKGLKMNVSGIKRCETIICLEEKIEAFENQQKEVIENLIKEKKDELEQIKKDVEDHSNKNVHKINKILK